MTPQGHGRQALIAQLEAARTSAPGGAVSLLLAEARPSGTEDFGWGSAGAEAVMDVLRKTALDTLEGGGIVLLQGAETLAVILPGAETLFAKVAADDLLNRLSSSAKETGAGIILAAGLASMPQDAQDAQGLLRAARTALRAAVRTGVEGVVTAQEALSNPSPEDTLIANLPPSRLEGREEALRSLHRRLQSCRSEAGAMVFIRGEPGIGKVSLLKEFSRRVPDDVFLLSARLDPTCPYKPYETVARAVERFAKERDVPPQRLARGMDEDMRLALSVVLPGFAVFSKGERIPCTNVFRRNLFQGFASILEQLGPQDTLVLAVSNAQWMDAASLELVSYMVRSRRQRILLAGTVEDLYIRGFGNQPFAVGELIEMAASIPFLHLLRLPRLSAQETASLIADLLPGAEKSPVAKLVERASGGIPLGVISSLRIAAPVLRNTGDGAVEPTSEISFPRTLNGQVEASMAKLPPRARRVMTALSVRGRPADASTLARIASLEPRQVEEALELLLEEVFLVEEEEGYWFSAEHYSGVAERSAGEEASAMHAAEAELAEAGASELALRASEDAEAAYTLLRRQAYALHHRAGSGDASSAERLKTGLRQTARLLYSPAEADEYMGGGAAPAPAPRRAQLDEEDISALSDFLDGSLEALSHIQHGTVTPLESPVKPRLTAAMDKFFRKQENLTLSFREGIPRGCGQPLSARRYGDAPSLIGQFAKARGVAVVAIDFRTKVDEWLWFLIGLGHEPNRITAPSDWTFWLRDKGVRFIHLEESSGFSGSPPVLAAPKGTETLPGAPQSAGAVAAAPVKHRRSGQGRSALFDTSVGMQAQTASPEVSKVLAEAGLPLGLSALKPDEKMLKAALSAVEKLLDSAHPSDAALLIERLASGLELAGTPERIGFYLFLPDILPVLRKLPDRSLYEKVARILVRQVEKEEEGAVLAAGVKGLASFAGFLVEYGHSDLASPLLSVLLRKGAPLRHGLSEAIARSDLVELVTADISSEDPLRQADAMPVAEVLAHLLPGRFLNVILSSESYRVRKAAAVALSGVEKKELEALVESALAASDEHSRARLVEVLDTLGVLRTDRLAELLSDPSEAVRAAAAALAGRLDENSVEDILSSIEERLGIEAALRTAVMLSSGGSTTVVLKAVVQNDPRLQKAAAGALGILTRRGTLSPRRALEALKALISKARRNYPQDPVEASALASAAIKALSLNPLPEAQKAISSLTDFPDPEISREALRALGEEDGETPS